MVNSMDHFKLKLKDYYRDLCIRENAFNNQFGHENRNYDQRRIVLSDIFLMTGMGYSEMDDIENDVNQFKWKQVLDNKNRIKYVKEDIE